MYGCESWTIKKAEHQRIDAFELWCWRRPLRVPWAARRSNQSILKEISPKYSLEGLMLKLHYLGHLIWGTDSLEKTLMLGKMEGRRRRGNRGWDGWMASLTQWTWVWVDSGSWWWMDREAWRAAVHGVSGSRTRLSDWTEVTEDRDWEVSRLWGHWGYAFMGRRGLGCRLDQPPAPWLPRE